MNWVGMRFSDSPIPPRHRRVDLMVVLQTETAFGEVPQPVSQGVGNGMFLGNDV
jgi:hypothetical protein